MIKAAIDNRTAGNQSRNQSPGTSPRNRSQLYLPRARKILAGASSLNGSFAPEHSISSLACRRAYAITLRKKPPGTSSFPLWCQL